MNWSVKSALFVALVGCSHALGGVPAEVRPGVGEPRVFVHASPDGVDLKAFLFSSEWDSAGELRPGIVLFHEADPATAADALARTDRFLKSLGYQP